MPRAMGPPRGGLAGLFFYLSAETREGRTFPTSSLPVAGQRVYHTNQLMRAYGSLASRSDQPETTDARAPPRVGGRIKEHVEVYVTRAAWPIPLHGVGGADRKHINGGDGCR
jgi:hypothetical protein